jgi:RHS repeat-associated protein
MSVTKVFSEAYNFSAPSSPVNPSSGGVDLSYPIASISSGLQCPATFTLCLQSKAGLLGTDDAFGFGSNWTLNVPRLDAANGLAYLSNGSVHKYNTTTLKLEYHKLQDCTITRAANSTYVIKYKNGTIDYLNANGQITKMVSASGQQLDFTYESTGAITETLTGISDGQGSSISITYPIRESGQSCLIYVAEHLPLGLKTTRFRLSDTVHGRFVLDNFSVPVTGAEQTQFTYEKVDNQLYVSTITSPNGQVQTFTYGAVNYSPTDTVRVVTKQEITGKNQGAAGDKKTIDYEYGAGNNFTGYLPGTAQLANTDNCLLRDNYYQYTVTEKHEDLEFERVFNRFHLLLRETLRSPGGAGLNTSKNYVYPIVAAGGLAEQPDNYSLWTRIWTTFIYSTDTSQSRAVSDTRSFDNYGNLLESTFDSGINVTNEYYPLAGDSTNCPADPNGFVNYLKRTVTKPDGYTNDTATPPKTLEFKYTAVAGRSYTAPSGEWNKTASMVLASEYKQNGTVLKTCTYNSTTTPELDVMFVGAPAREVSGSQTVDYTYTYDGRTRLALMEIVSTAGTLTTTSSRSLQPSSWNVVKEVAESGEITVREYDTLNRITRKTEYEGTTSERSETYAYANYRFIDTTYGYQNTVTITTPSGMQYINYINFFGLPSFSVEQTSATATPFCTQKLTYNSAGLIQTATEYDFCRLSAGINRSITSSTSYAYVQRNLTQINLADGTQQLYTTNPVSNTKTSRTDAGPIYTTTYNEFGLPVSLSYSLDGTVKVLERNTYDGFGRKTNTTSYSGGRTTTTFDLFDRILTQTVKGKLDSDRSDTTTYTYSSDIQSMSLPISLNSQTNLLTTSSPVLVSARTYDGLSRLTAEDTQRFTYNNACNDTPSISSYANVSNFSVTKTLDTNTQEVRSETVDVAANKRTEYSYSRSNTTGLITDSTTILKEDSAATPPVTTSTTTSRLQYTYNSRGAVTAINGIYSGGVATSLTKQYSSSGARLTASTNHLGLNEDFDYRSAGEVTGKGYDGIATLGIIYDAIGNISSIEVFSAKFANTPDGNALASIDFVYDSVGRETNRMTKFATTSGLKQVLDVENDYDHDSSINSWSVQHGEWDPIQVKGYAYDEQYGQLKSSTIQSNTFFPMVTYSHVGGNRLATVTETGKSAETYTYVQDRLTQFARGTQTKSLTEDSAGNITQDFDTRTIQYDAANRMVAVTIAGDAGDYKYSYDPAGRLCQITKGAVSVTYVYDGDTLVGEICGTTKTLYLRVANVVIGRYIQKGADETLELYATDSSGSVRTVRKLSPGRAGQNILSTVYYDYSDYGVRTANTAVTPIDATNFIDRNTLGFNGCLFDDVSNTYLLGNGYRAYSPVLRTFYSRDSLSPYGGAGVNRYQYCQLDPINNIDPSGHLSTSAQWGIGLSVVGIALAAIPIVGTVAAGTLWSLAGGLAVTGAVLGVTGSSLAIASHATEDNAELSRNLGYASLAFGIASIVTSLSSNVVRSVSKFRAESLKYTAQAQSFALKNGGKAYSTMEYYEAIPEIYRSERIVAEGAPFITQTTSAWLDDGAQLATRLRPILQGTGRVDLASCQSAFGGTYASVAQRLANNLNRKVIGYIGRVEPFAGRAPRPVTFIPQTGFAAARTAVLNSAGSKITKFMLYGIVN